MVLKALFPVFGLIGLGWGMFRAGFPGPGFWPMAERITYFALFPSLLFSKLALAEANPLTAWPMALAMIGALAAMVALLEITRKYMGVDGPGFTSVFQGSIRPNTYVGLAVAAALLPDEAMAGAAVAVAVMVPSVNVLSVWALSRHGEGASGSLMGPVRGMASNPLIWACGLGIAVNVAGLVIYPPLMGGFEALGRASLPLGLLAVGAGLRFEEITKMARGVAWASVFKLCALPLFCFILLKLLGVSHQWSGAAMIFTAIPASASSYVLAGQLGGDQKLMAAIITAQTVIASVTLPIVLF